MLQAAPGSEGVRESSASDAVKKRVLLIEDEPSTRLVLLQKLRSAGLDVEVAANGKIALEKIRSHSPDAIFMDLLLPRVKGVDVIKAARQDPQFANRPIYVCTSAALMRVWTRRGTKAGATKVFNRASTPIDAIVAEVAAVLLGHELPAMPAEKTPLINAAPREHREIPQPPGPPVQRKASANKVPLRPFNFMKRVVQTLGLSWKSRPPNESVAPANPEPAHATQEPTPASPAAEPFQNTLSIDTDASSTESQILSEAANANPFDAINTPATDPGVAVLTLDEGARILSANKTCTNMFGWEGTALVGQNLQLLLKDGLEQDIAKLLQQQRAGDQTKVACPLLTVGRRKDGTEFPVSVTTLTWSSDTTMIRRTDSSQFCWTAFIRDMASPPEFQDQSAATSIRDSSIGAESIAAADTFQLQEQFETLRRTNEELQKQIEEISGDAAKRHEDLTRREKEREELAGRVFENETELNKARSELERESEERRQLERKLQDLRNELEQQASEHGRLEAEWREQLQSAEALTKKLEAGWQEEVGRNRGFDERLQILGNSLRLEQAERSRRFEEEVLGLRRERNELQNKLADEQHAAAEFKQRTEELETRLRDSATEAERVKAELEKQAAEQQGLESEWREKLKTAEELTNKLEAAWIDSEAHNKRSEEELTGLRHVRDNLESKLAGEQQAAAESGRRNDELSARVVENAVELQRIKVELEQAGLNEQFDERLNGLEQVRAELHGELRTEQKVTAESRQRIEDLENRLRENAAELERVKAEADRHAEEQARLESELNAQLDAANSAARHAEAALQEKTAQCSHVESQLAILEQLRDELGGKLTAEQQAAAKSRQRGEELESRLQESATELERVRAEYDKQAEEQARLESELRAQLDAAKAAAEQAEAALQLEAANNRGFEERLRVFGNSLRLQQVESSERFENELTTLQQVRDELGSKLAAEHRAAAESRQRSEELENQLRESAVELERVRAELTRHSKEQAQLESDQRAQLDAGRAATEKAEAAWLEEAERSKRFEEELEDLRQERDELNQKFTAEQQAVAASGRQSQEWENGLRETAAELERVQAELARHSEERARVESEHRAQLDAANAASEEAAAIRLEAVAHSKRFEEELAGLRQERDRLNQQFKAGQQTLAESKRHSDELEGRLRETSMELERVWAEMVRLTEGRTQLESEQRAQVDTAKAAVARAEAALAEKTTLCNQFQEEAATLWQECETVSARLTAEQQAAAGFKQRAEELQNRLLENDSEIARTRAVQHEQAEELKRLEAEWREQLSSAQTAAARAQEALREGVAEQRKLERSLTNLRNERLQVYDKFKAEHAANEKGRRRIGELEKRLRERATELGHAKSELKKQIAERDRIESELREELETARATAQRELENLRQESGTLNGRLTAEQQSSAQFRRRTEELEGRLHESATELERIKAELDQHARERAGLESERQTFAEAREALGLEMRHLRESEAAHKAEAAEMEGQLAESIALFARATTELETERSEHHRVEQRAASLATESRQLHEELRQHLESEQANEQRLAGLMQQLREREDAVTRVSTDLQREIVNRQMAEDQLRATANFGEQLRSHLTLIEEAKEIFASRERDLEARLQASLNALRESESSIEKESGERRRLEEALQAAQRESQRQGESNAIELARLKSAVQLEQLERKGLEAQAIQSRFSSLDSTRVGVEMVNNFRNRLRQPIDKLMQSARRLLESQPEGEQKKLVESVLESALLLQTNVGESGSSNVASADARSESERGSADARSRGTIPSEASGGLQP